MQVLFTGPSPGVRTLRPLLTTRRLAQTIAIAIVTLALAAGSAVAMPPDGDTGGGGGGGGGEPAPEPPAAKSFRVHLESLECLVSEDWFYGDEPYLTFNGRRIWSAANLDDPNSVTVGVTESSSGSARVKLYDADTGIFDADDFLGEITVGEDQIGQGLQVGKFSLDGADYSLYYTVSAA